MVPYPFFLCTHGGAGYKCYAMSRLLFLSSGHACRSQMAEMLTRRRGVGDVEIVSAGTELADSPHPLAVEVMKDLNLDLAETSPKSLADLLGTEFDVIVVLDAAASVACPPLPGNPQHVDWNIQDPSKTEGKQTVKKQAFLSCRDEIDRLVTDMFDHGFFTALCLAKQCENTILDNITDGIIAHDMQRRVFHFNCAAEEITGYARAEVIGKDCHEVFPGKFCGGQCSFCEDTPPSVEMVKRELEISTKDGGRRLVAMTVCAMRDALGHQIGVLVSFRDFTREHRLARRIGEIQQFSGIIGKDHAMQDVYDLIRDLASSNVPVLIQGESGTGKELVAAAIHNEGQRAGKLFVPVNCGALPEALLESELFGHVKGAFTGAIRDKKGRFELADGGSIFLDEIGDISLAMQVKLLRVLQEGRFERVGGETTMRVNVRIISATNKHLAEEIQEGRFREDLFYRLNVVPIFLPPLRERRNDIPILIEHTLGALVKELGRKPIKVSPRALDIMMSHEWPGNVRELQNWLQFALVKCRGSLIEPEHLPPSAFAGLPGRAPRRRRRKLDVDSVRRALDQAGGNKVEAAKILGVSRATLYRFLDDAGL